MNEYTDDERREEAEAAWGTELERLRELRSEELGEEYDDGRDDWVAGALVEWEESMDGGSDHERFIENYLDAALDAAGAE